MSPWVALLAQDNVFDKESFEFTTRAFGNDYFEGIHFYDAEEKRVQLEFNPYERTGIYHLPEGVTEVPFIRLEVGERGREQEETVAVADLDGIESRAFIVFVARRDVRRDLPYTVYVADESPGKFEAGHLRFLNLAGPPLLARVGDESISLSYGFGGDLSFDSKSIQELRFQFAVRVDQEWRIVYSSGFRPHPDLGTLAILKPPAQINSMQIQIEFDYGGFFPEPIPKVETAPES